MALVVKNSPANETDIGDEMWVQALGWEDPLKVGMATHFSILSWRIPWKEEPGGLQSIWLQRVILDSRDLAHRQPFSGMLKPKLLEK